MAQDTYHPQNSRLAPYSDKISTFLEGKTSPRDYLETCLETIDEHEGDVKAFTALNIESARRAADEASNRYRQARSLSDVDGMPIGVKDVIETIDMPTQMGSPLFDGWQSNRDAASVYALREAGGIILGKTVTCEFATLAPGPTRNPFDLTRTPGGSSSGSAAAVGYGMVPAALGTQVVGSILRPASYCGAIGFKPSVGGFNRGGVHDYLSQSCLGVLAASLADAWAVSHVIASLTGGDPGFSGFCGPQTLPAANKPKRVIVLESAGWAQTAPPVKQALERVGTILENDNIQCITRHDLAAIEEYEILIAGAAELSRKINTWEFRWPLNTYHNSDSKALSPILRDRLAQAEQMSLEDYQQALERRKAARAVHETLARHADCLITLSATGAAPSGLERTGNPAFNIPASLLGVPAISLPMLVSEGLPLGIQIMGFTNKDAAMFANATWLEAILKK